VYCICSHQRCSLWLYWKCVILYSFLCITGWLHKTQVRNYSVTDTSRVCPAVGQCEAMWVTDISPAVKLSPKCLYKFDLICTRCITVLCSIPHLRKFDLICTSCITKLMTIVPFSTPHLHKFTLICTSCITNEHCTVFHPSFVQAT